MESDWEIVLTSESRSGHLRYLTIHALSAIVGRNPYTLIEEMQESGTTYPSHCGNVNTQVLHFRGYPLVGYDSWEWEKVRESLSLFPIESVKGFNYNGRTRDIPLNQNETGYASSIIKNLELAGYKPNIRIVKNAKGRRTIEVINKEFYK